MKKFITMTIFMVTIFLVYTPPTNAHFGCIVPSENVVTKEDNKDVVLDIKFFHPMENDYMDMQKPRQLGVLVNGKKEDLLGSIKETETDGHTTWETVYTIKRPGDYNFYVEPVPYWEPAEDCYIIHYTKVCVNALGLEEGWDEEIGLATEIIPLTRPYGLWTGNIFTGIVKLDGNPVPYAEIEVEYYNEEGKIDPSSGPYITQVIKADENGVFSYAMPKEGWWGFAALNEAPYTIKDPNGKEKAVEIGAVYWVYVQDME